MPSSHSFEADRAWRILGIQMTPTRIPKIQFTNVFEKKHTQGQSKKLLDDFICFFFTENSECSVGFTDVKVCQESLSSHFGLQHPCLGSWACTYICTQACMNVIERTTSCCIIMPTYCCWSCSWSINCLPWANLARQQHSQQNDIVNQ